MLKAQKASIRLTAPDGSQSVHELNDRRTTIGRETPVESPDLVLDPDPYRFVSRIHCVIEQSPGSWILTDNASDNGTIIRRTGEVARVIGSVELCHGDAILVLADVGVDGTPIYWELWFDDPFCTLKAATLEESSRSAVDSNSSPYLEYDWMQMKAFRVDDDGRVEITGLSPQSHKLIRFMADLSRGNNGSPVACETRRLIHMMWGAPDEWPLGRAYDETNLRNVINATRRKIEKDPSSPRLLQLERGFGYRLEVRA